MNRYSIIGAMSVGVTLVLTAGRERNLRTTVHPRVSVKTGSAVAARPGGRRGRRGLRASSRRNRSSGARARAAHPGRHNTLAAVGCQPWQEIF